MANKYEAPMTIAEKAYGDLVDGFSRIATALKKDIDIIRARPSDGVDPVLDRLSAHADKLSTLAGNVKDLADANDAATQDNGGATPAPPTTTP